MKVAVYDPPMCCPTGVCGPAVDPALPRFAADLDWLRRQGIKVERFNLAQDPGAFARNPIIKEALTNKGNSCLPIILVDEKIVSEAAYPSLEKLSAYVGLACAGAPSLFTDQVAELIAIGAAIASNCEPCFRYHYDKARKLGVSKEDMARAVAMAQTVKETPARAVLELADKYLNPKSDRVEQEAPAVPSDMGSTGTRGKCG